MRHLLIAGALSLLAATTASAQVASTENGRADTDIGKNAKNPDKVVCITEDVTGSRLGSVKTCHTNAEWAQYQREMRNTVDHVQAGKSYQIGQGGGAFSPGG